MCFLINMVILVYPLTKIPVMHTCCSLWLFCGCHWIYTNVEISFNNFMFHSFLAVFVEVENLMESRILRGKDIDLCGFELKFGFLSVHLLALPVMFVQKRMFSNLSFFHLWLNSFRSQQNNFSSFIGHSDRN